MAHAVVCRRMGKLEASWRSVRTMLGATSQAPLSHDDAAADQHTANSSANDSSSSPRKQPIRASHVAAAGLANCAHFYAICSIFSYAGFLAVDNGWAADIDSAGYTAGLLPTALILGRLPTAIPWGMACDRWGTRRSLQLSMLFVMIGNLSFGLSSSLPASLASRALFLGAGNGYTTIMGPMIEEIGGERQAQVTAWVLSFGGVINLTGPAVGAFTYNSLGGGRCPALAPSIIGSAMAFVTVLTSAALPGPRKKPQLARGARTKAPRRSVCSLILCSSMLRLVLVRAGCGLLMFGVFDVIPLWAIASEAAGGLGLSKRVLGLLLAGSSIIQLVFSATIMGKTIERLGTIRTIRWGLYVSAAVLCLLPFVRDAGAGAGRTIGVVCASLLHSLLVISILCSMTAAVTGSNHLFAHTPEIKGTLNGIVAMVEAVGKLLGPGLCAPLLAALVSNLPLIRDELMPNATQDDERLYDIGWFDILESGAFVTFFILASASMALALLSFGLPLEVQAPPPPTQPPSEATEITEKQEPIFTSSTAVTASLADAFDDEANPRGPDTQTV